MNDFSYEVPLSYALAISSIITEQYLKDPTLKKFNIKISPNGNKKINDKKIQEEFCQFIKGEKISSEIFYQIAINLQNKEMIKEWSKKQELTKETVLTIIKANHKLYNNRKDKHLAIKSIEKELEFIGEHIEEMKKEIQELTEEELLFILSNDKMKVEKEDLIWEIIKGRIEKKYQNNLDDKQKNKSILMGKIEAKYLKKEYFIEYIEYIENIEEEDIEREPKIFKNLKEILISLGENIQKLNDKVKGLEITHKYGNDFDGIIKYLENKYGENIIQKGIISIEISSNNNLLVDPYAAPKIQMVQDPFATPPKQIIQDPFADPFAINVPNSWFEVNFKNNKVKINGYSLKSSNNSSSYYHLKSW